MCLSAGFLYFYFFRFLYYFSILYTFVLSYLPAHNCKMEIFLKCRRGALFLVLCETDTNEARLSYSIVVIAKLKYESRMKH